jgi:chitin synthase
MVVVKVGKPTERSKPGNRGKRDSQILLLHYLNRVHFDAPMSPLELEIYHQMRNVIGIDPAFYEYIFTIDADTVRKKHYHPTNGSLTKPFTVRESGFFESAGGYCC